MSKSEEISETVFKTTWRVLIVEDSKIDAALLIRELNQSNFKIFSTVVETEAAFKASLSLEDAHWDFIISDYRLPHFGALEALAVLKGSGRDLPFIIVSGVVGEEMAVDAMKKGAHDFFLKGKFHRLLPAIEREIAEALNRGAKLTAESLLKTAIAELEAEKILRESFVTTLSHDLRTPLNCSMAAVQLIVRNKGSAEKTEELSKTALRNLTRLNRMIENLLDANRLKAGGLLPITPAVCLLNDVIAAVVTDFPTDSGNRIVFNSTKATHAFSDSDAVCRIVENLLGNAAKYGQAKSDVTIELKEAGPMIEISVHNHGIPISPQDQATLFNTFMRTDSAKAGNKKGWGIGLALVRAYAEAHGGKATVSSSEKDGTKFVVSFLQDAREPVARHT
jgi:K+-sensing histidine kinase KdpD